MELVEITRGHLWVKVGGKSITIYGEAFLRGYGKPIRSSGAAIYHLPTPLKRDGFITHDVVFASSTIGVLVEGNVAEKLARHYDLAPEKLNIINMSGFARQLPDGEQNLRELGLISIVALKSNAFKDKTLLACQFVSNQDRKNIDYINKN